MLDLQAAIYARVSSDQQANDHTIASQVAALRERVATDGLALPTDREFIDEGYSGATLVRPALERLRDLAAAGGIDRLYVHSPDRLARKYAYQVLVVDELQRVGVEIIFLNRELGRSPEDDLLLQVQGMVAEYERAKILERSRRGKRHGAQTGAVSVLCGAPYGYRYVRRADGGGQARYEILLEEARVVRQVFDWVGRERLSIGEVRRRLDQAGERTRSGKTTWDRTTIWGMLKNPAYMGRAAFGKTQAGPLQPRLRAQRGRPLQPRRAVSPVAVSPEDWIAVPVPALVSEDLFAAVQEQLQENRQRARQGERGARYLLQGLICCALCGYAYYGKAISPSARKGHPRHYAYYRCIGSDAYRFGGTRLCHNKQVRTDLVDAAVWQEVCTLLKEPDRLQEEYERRLHDPARAGRHDDLTSLESQIRKLRQGMGRLIDSYAEGLIDKGDFEPRITRLKERIAALEGQVQDVRAEAAQQQELRLVMGKLEDFATAVRDNLEQADWETQRTIMRALVKRVEIDQEQVNVVFRIGPNLNNPGPTTAVLPDCGRSDQSLTSECGASWPGDGTGDLSGLPEPACGRPLRR
jgi:site-specific DNA recombinase